MCKVLSLLTSEKCFRWCLIQLLKIFFSPDGVSKAEMRGPKKNMSCVLMAGWQAVKTDLVSNQCSTDPWELFILQIFS